MSIDKINKGSQLPEYGTPEHDTLWADFRDKTNLDITDIGISKGLGLREMQSVSERLFEETSGDPSQATKERIAELSNFLQRSTE